MKAKALHLIIPAIVLVACASVATSAPSEIASQATPTEVITSDITQDTAIEAAQKSCGSFRSIQLEESYESQASLMSYEDGYKKILEGNIDPSTELDGDPVWFVQIKGKWQGFGFPLGGLTPTPSRTPTIWEICKVLVDAQSGVAFSKSYR